MPKYSGTLILFKSSETGDVEILANVEGASWDSSFELPDVTDKDSGGYREYLTGTGILDASISVNGFAKFGTGGNIAKLAGHLQSRKKINFLFGPDKADTFNFTGKCLFNEHALDTPNEAGATFTATATVADKWDAAVQFAVNEIRNNTMVGGEAGTPGTVPTFWEATSTGGGITREIVGIGTEAGIDYIDFKYSGTPDPGPGATINIFPDGQDTAAEAEQGETWTGSSYIRLAGGSLANTTTRFRLNGRTVDASIAGEETLKTFVLTSSGLETQRFDVTRTMVDATVARVRLTIDLIFSGAVDITVRIGWPQLQTGPIATSPVETSP